MSRSDGHLVVALLLMLVILHLPGFSFLSLSNFEAGLLGVAGLWTLRGMIAHAKEDR